MGGIFYPKKVELTRVFWIWSNDHGNKSERVGGGEYRQKSTGFDKPEYVGVFLPNLYDPDLYMDQMADWWIGDVPGH